MYYYKRCLSFLLLATELDDYDQLITFVIVRLTKEKQQCGRRHAAQTLFSVECAAGTPRRIKSNINYFYCVKLNKNL